MSQDHFDIDALIDEVETKVKDQDWKLIDARQQHNPKVLANAERRLWLAALLQVLWLNDCIKGPAKQRGEAS